MGVSGLLPALKSIQTPISLEKYKGKRLAIDTYAWLHKGIFSCSLQLVLGHPTRAYIDYVLRKVRMLRHFQIEPYLVFDGDHLPSKAGTEEERRKRRQTYKQRAIDALERHDRREAMGFCQKACDITPEMAKSLIEELKRCKIKYVVAPYEADSQMVYLEKSGLVDGIISEDSDLLVFGCQTLLTKMDDYGSCMEILRANFNKCRNNAISRLNQYEIQLTAIISGCDYTKGIPGLGVLKAATLVSRFRSFKRVIMALRFDGKVDVPSTFEADYKRASIAFRYPIVFDPVKKLPVHLNPVPNDVKEPKSYILSCTGNILDVELHQRIASGDLNPFTKELLVPRERSLRPACDTMKKSASFTGRQASTLDKFCAHRCKSMPAVPEKKLEADIGRLYSPRTKRDKALLTIDNFFKRMKDSGSQSSPIKHQKLETTFKRKLQDEEESSPLAKRARIINAGSSKNSCSGMVSKFFAKKEVEHAKVEKVAEESEDEQIEDESFLNANSSEFIVSDLEDDDINEDAAKKNAIKPEVATANTKFPPNTNLVKGPANKENRSNNPPKTGKVSKLIQSFSYSTMSNKPFRKPLQDITNVQKSKPNKAYKLDLKEREPKAGIRSLRSFRFIGSA